MKMPATYGQVEWDSYTADVCCELDGPEDLAAIRIGQVYYRGEPTYGTIEMYRMAYGLAVEQWRDFDVD